ncbi:hypothetical protein TFLX_06075 [Thermoflexales bacterium]|nr:hypothetical protein TFLX_06075 [Thermoflexales bacterium]
MFTNTTLKTRRNRLSPYTTAERRLNKAVVVADDPIVTRHVERGLTRKSHARKSQR